MWLDVRVIIVIVCALVVAVALRYLHALLMVAFPALVVRRLPPDMPLPTATADLYEKAIAELATLGFSPPQWIVVAPERETPGAFATVAAAFCHAEKNTLAILHPPLHIAAPNDLTTQFLTRLADGRGLTGLVREPLSQAFSDDKFLTQSIIGTTLAEQWAQHLRWVESFKTPAAAGFGSLETLPAELQEIRGYAARLTATGKLWRDAQGVARPTLAFALRLLWLYWTRPRKKINKAAVPLARQAMFAAFYEHWQKRSLPLRWQWLLLTASSVFFAVVYILLMGIVSSDPLRGMRWAIALVFLGAILLYEGVRILAMRALGFRQISLQPFPFQSCPAAGIEQNPNATRYVWAALLGTLPGIALGWALIFFAIVNDEAAMGSAAAMLLAFNYCYLLPIPPLVGGRIAQALLPPLLSNNLMAQLLKADASFRRAPPDQQQRRILEVLQQRFGEPANLLRRLLKLRAIMQALKQTPMRRNQRIALTALFLALWCLPLLFWALATMKVQLPSHTPPNIDPEKQKQTQQRIFLSLGGMSVPQLLMRMPVPKPIARKDWGWFSQFRKPPSSPPLPAPADPEKVAEAEKRLGLTFPDDYRELLSRYDGYPPLQLLPVAQIRHLSETPFSREKDIKTPRPFYSFAFPLSSFAANNTEIVPGQRVWNIETLQNCAVIGGAISQLVYRDPKYTAAAEVYPTLLWCQGQDFEQARIISLVEKLWAPDFTTYLRYSVTQRMARRELVDSALKSNANPN
ncbi:MAG: hypothetical protein LBB65_08675 [Burkholderiales bacterium]|jgi:hypothetical protein|nr:hypothetical protein [Burkholderiales bacterium]